ncbi:hypothetical protein HK104_007786, partial [Borealophlyctis nickersoniae]
DEDVVCETVGSGLQQSLKRKAPTPPRVTKQLCTRGVTTPNGGEGGGVEQGKHNDGVFRGPVVVDERRRRDSTVGPEQEEDVDVEVIDLTLDDEDEGGVGGGVKSEAAVRGSAAGVAGASGSASQSVVVGSRGKAARKSASASTPSRPPGPKEDEILIVSDSEDERGPPPPPPPPPDPATVVQATWQGILEEYRKTHPTLSEEVSLLSSDDEPGPQTVKDERPRSGPGGMAGTVGVGTVPRVSQPTLDSDSDSDADPIVSYGASANAFACRVKEGGAGGGLVSGGTGKAVADASRGVDPIVGYGASANSFACRVKEGGAGGGLVSGGNGNPIAEASPREEEGTRSTLARTPSQTNTRQTGRKRPQSTSPDPLTNNARNQLRERNNIATSPP